MAADDDPRDVPADAEAPTEADEKILEDLRAFWDYDTLNWEPIRREADIDVQYAAGNTWNADDKAARAGRPMLNLDQLSQYSNQLENTIRQNKRAIKASPAGNGATDKTAELRSNRIREIEYQSHAQEAYIQAFANCAMRSYGFARIVAEYEDEESRNQVLRVKAVANPNQVLPDSDAESTSGRDWTRLFFVRSVSMSEFRRDWPTARIQSFTPELIARSGKWVTVDRVQIAEYWTVKTTETGMGRPKREVCQYITNGVELLHKRNRPKKTPWKGKYIPFMSCYGKILYKSTDAGDSEKIMLSYIRLARDGAKSYNWTKSTELEALALPVRAALIAYEGQMDQPQVDEVARATREPVPVIFAKAQTEATGVAILPLPQYGTRMPDIQGYEIAAESFRRDVQNALGRYSAQDHRLGSTKVTSGVALKELDKSGDLGSYHFIDHYDDMIMFCGEQIDDLLPFYDDTEKEIAVRLPDGSPKMQWVNRKTGRAQDGSPAYGPDDLRMDVGRHTITISTGPSFDSQREAGKEAAMTLLGNTQAFPIVASDAVRLMDLGPIGDQMAEDLEWLQPPPMKQAREQQGKDGQPDPKALQQQVAQMGQQLQHAEQTMQAMDQELKGKQAELASKERIEQMKIEADERLQVQLQTMKDATTIAAAHIAAAAKGVELEQHSTDEAIALNHEAQQKELDRQHQAELHAQSLAHQGQVADLNAKVKVDTAAKAADVKTMQIQQILRRRDGDGASPEL